MDKAAAPLGGQPLLAHVIARATAQCERVVVNAGDPAPAWLPDGIACVADATPGHLGPLAGLLTGLRYLEERAPTIDWLATFPVDTPFVPLDVVARLHAARGDAPGIVCVSRGRLHAALGLWAKGLCGELREALTIEGLRRADAWVERSGAARLELSATPLDPCFNINTPADLATAERLLGDH